MTTTYTYDGLNRITSAHEEGVGLNTTRTYQYDSLGNLIREEQDGCVEYKYNGFALDESTKCGTIPNSIGTSFWEYTYDGRGNLISNDKYTRTTSGMAWQNEETYVYDETNHMVDGKNELGERSLYTYNGLGLRVGRELIMKDNTHGYTDFHDETPSVETGIDKPEVVKESYVIDYTSPTFQTLVMEEEGGFDDRWVYGLDKLSVKITSEGTNWWGQNVKTDILKDYLHQDRLGNTTNLTDKFGRVVAAPTTTSGARSPTRKPCPSPAATAAFIPSSTTPATTGTMCWVCTTPRRVSTIPTQSGSWRSTPSRAASPIRCPSFPTSTAWIIRSGGWTRWGW